MLEELKRATNRRDDEVAIGVTFMGYDKIEEEYVKNERRGVKSILSICCCSIKSLHLVDDDDDDDEMKVMLPIDSLNGSMQ